MGSIAQYLSTRDLFAVCSLCRGWYDFCRNRRVLQERYDRALHVWTVLIPAEDAAIDALPDDPVNANTERADRYIAFLNWKDQALEEMFWASAAFKRPGFQRLRLLFPPGSQFDRDGQGGHQDFYIAWQRNQDQRVFAATDIPPAQVGPAEITAWAPTEVVLQSSEVFDATPVPQPFVRQGAHAQWEARFPYFRVLYQLIPYRGGDWPPEATAEIVIMRTF